MRATLLCVRAAVHVCTPDRQKAVARCLASIVTRGMSGPHLPLRYVRSFY